MSEDYLIAEFLKPDWSDLNPVHNWKNYISGELKQMWDSFTDEQKIAIGRSANDRASDELWE